MRQEHQFHDVILVKLIIASDLTKEDSMRPNHYQFVAFAYVVREGSFSAAAAELGVTQSTITQHVAKLEHNVGAQLLWRRRDGVEVTPTGQALYDLADRLVAVDTAISERLDGFASMQEGRIRVIANAPQPALEVIARFHQSYPGIHIDFGLHDWTTATSMIRDRLADVGLITDPPQNDDWECDMLQRTKYVAYCRSDHQLANASRVFLKDLVGETIILPEKGSLTHRIVSGRLKQTGLKLQKFVQMTSFPLMCEAVLQGIGVAIFLQNSSLINDGLVEIELADLNKQHETWLVATKDRINLKLVSEFRSTAIAQTIRTS